MTLYQEVPFDATNLAHFIFTPEELGYWLAVLLIGWLLLKFLGLVLRSAFAALLDRLADWWPWLKGRFSVYCNRCGHKVCDTDDDYGV